MKLVTGVDISTRAVNKSGRPGDANSNSLTTIAEPKRAAFLLSTLIVDVR